MVRKYQKYIRGLTKLRVAIKITGHGRNTARSKTLTRKTTLKLVRR